MKTIHQDPMPFMKLYSYVGIMEDCAKASSSYFASTDKS